MPRFDIGPAAPFESRDGGLTKGGLIRNGFLEKAKDGKAWVWQRPALSSAAAAPLTGNGLGLYIVGTGTAASLWGAYYAATGTAAFGARIVIQRGTSTTKFILDAGTFPGGGVGYEGTGTGYGGLTPSTWAGFQIANFYGGTSTATNNGLQVAFVGTTTKGVFTSLRLDANTYLTSTATHGTVGGVTFWNWALGTLNPGVHTGNFIRP